MVKCNWIENMISVETDGWSRPCCLETNNDARISNIGNGIKIAFNHPKLLKLRDDLANGFSANTRFACNRCEQMEEATGNSLRTQTASMSHDRELKLIQFKMSNKCQLACAHCGPDRSSTWGKLLEIKPHVINAFNLTDVFLTELAELLPTISVLKFSGGEPFLDPAHWKILKFLQPFNRSHCKLVYITNGLVAPQVDLWQGWQSVDCSVSADGYDKSFEWFRRGANWQELVSKVDNLSKWSNVSINFSVTPFTIGDYHKAKQFWNFPFHGFPIIHPAHCNLNQFPRRILETIDQFNTIPGIKLAESDGNIDKYINWANWWDKKWNTDGLSTTSVPWIYR